MSSNYIAFTEPEVIKTSSKYCPICEKEISNKGWYVHGKTKKHLNNIELVIYRN